MIIRLLKNANLTILLINSSLEVETNLSNQINKPEHHIKVECSRSAKGPKLTQRSSTNRSRPIHVAKTSTFSNNLELFKHNDDNKVTKDCKFNHPIDK